MPTADFFRARRPRDGDAERAHAGGLARGLSADGAAWVLLELRGVRAHHRLDVQPACEVAGEVEAGAALEGADLVAEPADHVAGVAAGPQRIHAPGPGISGRGDEQESGGDADLSAAGCELPVSVGGPLSALDRLRERDCRGQGGAPAVSDDGRRRSTIAPRASGSGTSPRTTMARSRMW